MNDTPVFRCPPITLCEVLNYYITICTVTIRSSITLHLASTQGGWGPCLLMFDTGAYLTFGPFEMKNILYSYL